MSASWNGRCYLEAYLIARDELCPLQAFAEPREFSQSPQWDLQIIDLLGFLLIIEWAVYIVPKASATKYIVLFSVVGV